MLAPLRDFAVILLVLETLVMLLVPALLVFGAAYGVNRLRRKLPLLFAQARKYVGLFKFYVERACASSVAPLLAAQALAAQARGWWRYVSGTAQEGN